MPRSRLAPLTLALALLLTVVAASAASGGILGDQAHTGTVRCKAVAKGTPWSYKGHKGSLYTIEGNRATACAVGVKWLLRLTNMRGVPKTPTGWNCMTYVSFPGQCEKSGVVFAWNAKLR